MIAVTGVCGLSPSLCFCEAKAASPLCASLSFSSALLSLRTDPVWVALSLWSDTVNSKE